MQRGKIVIVYSNKGGVGKTFIARALADFYEQIGQAWMGFDADHTSGKFWQFYRERTHTVDLRQAETLTPIVTVAQQAVRVALMDVPSAHGAELIAWLKASGLLRRNAPVEVVLCLLITTERDTVECAVDARAELGGKVTWLIVKNALRGSHYASYDASHIRQRLRKTGAREIEIPCLFQSTEEELKAQTLTFDAALSGTRLHLTPRHRLFVWRNKTFAAFRQVTEVLCPMPL